METTADRYRRLAGAFADAVAAVPEDAWDAPSPCEEWSARDVVDHVVKTQGMFLGFVGGELAPGPPDPAGAWASASAQTQAVLDDPQRAAQEFDGLMGRSSYADAVDRFLCTDLVVHGWDLATATGQGWTAAPEDLSKVRDVVASFGDAARSPGAFGPELEAPADADEQTKVLALVGRKA
jgi:uncharacterized protein (TIGR03086 family)